MIGQQKILDIIKDFISLDNTSATTMIIQGDRGSGKRTAIKEATKRKKKLLVYWVEDLKKDTIRDLIADSGKIESPIVYIIPNIDDMPKASMSTLLKLTEEPPENAKIIMTCENIYNILPTIRSRALTYNMAPYTKEELMEYYDSEEHWNTVATVCTTPGDIDILKENGIKEFEDYLTLVFNNICTVSDANAFKIGNKLAFKEDSKGFDLRLFFRGFSVMCMVAYISSKEDSPIENMYYQWIQLTDRYLQEMTLNGINKSALFDCWVLDIRRSSEEYGETHKS